MSAAQGIISVIGQGMQGQAVEEAAAGPEAASCGGCLKGAAVLGLHRTAFCTFCSRRPGACTVIDVPLPVRTSHAAGGQDTDQGLVCNRASSVSVRCSCSNLSARHRHNAGVGPYRGLHLSAALQASPGSGRCPRQVLACRGLDQSRRAARPTTLMPGRCMMQVQAHRRPSPVLARCSFSKSPPEGAWRVFSIE